MNSSEFGKLFRSVWKDLEETMANKSHDYATEDILSNFKRLSKAATILGITLDTPMGYALFMVLMKLDRVNNLFSKNTAPKNESVKNSFTDLLGYTLLAIALDEEVVNKDTTI